MDKIYKRWTILIVILLLVLIMGAWFVSRRISGSSSEKIRAWVSPKEVELGNPIRFIDSTSNAKEVLWEFGNGDFSKEKSGSYVFPQSGRYQVRLKVNNALEQRFIVQVKESRRITDFRTIKIVAPQIAVQNEYISFFADGYSKEWRWEFGETGDIDSYEKNPTYSYKLPGVYQIKLSSEDTAIPVIHHIEIIPEYNETETSDVLSLIAQDIKEHLQNIIDGASFNENYNYILNKYLCNNPTQIVVANGGESVDFYSYCCGLKIIGSQQAASIGEVVVEPDKESNCIKRILIKQHSLTPQNK